MIKAVSLERDNVSMGSQGPFYKYTVHASGEVNLSGSQDHERDGLVSWNITADQFQQILNLLTSHDFFEQEEEVVPVVTTGGGRCKIAVQKLDGTSHIVYIGYSQYFSKITHNQLNSWLREAFDLEFFELSHSDLDPLVAMNCLAYDIDNIVGIHQHLNKELVDDSVFIE